ncbi:MAG: zinc-ribbon domain-containing protein [Thermoanaerobaculaceae bacterium]
MALRECPQCGHPIPDGDRACPSCGAVPSSQRKWLWVAFACLGVLVTAGVYVGMFQPELMRRKAEAKLTPLELMQAQVDQLLSTTTTITKMQGHVIWVEPGMWKMRSEEDRAALASLIGTYAGLKDGSNQARCEVRDNRNGKVIAEWSQAGGLVTVAP